MTVAVEYIPTQIEYPDEDGKPMAEGDVQCSYLIYTRSALRLHFDRPDVYVAGNLFIYYEQGNPESVVAPDVFVVFGVDNKDRRSYKTWEEQDLTPDFVLEITSKTTRAKDQGAKKGIYAFLGVREYFQYDPTGDYLNPQLQGLRLDEGNYFPVPTNTLADGISLPSEVLGLELQVKSGQMRFFDPATGQNLLTYKEQAAAQQQAQAAQQQAQAAQQQAEAAQQQAEAAQQQAESRAQRLAAKLRELNIDPDQI